MVRRFPTDDNTLIHPAVSFSLLAAGMAAAIAMISTLCGVRSRRRSPPASAPSSSPISNAAADLKASDDNASPPPMSNLGTSPSASAAAAGSGGEGEFSPENEQQAMKELPLPPKMKQVMTNNSCPVKNNNQMSKSASEKKLNHIRSMSFKVPRSLSMVRNRDPKGGEKRKEKMKIEDQTIWTKTIILGEKCKVSDEEDATIYEGKGKKISAYHPRAPSAMSITISRQNSFAETETDSKY